MVTFENIRGHTVYTPPLGRESVIVDLGANRGEFSRQIHGRFGGRCFLVEANPRLASALVLEGQFPVRRCAIGAEDGTVLFHLTENDEASSILDVSSANVHSGGVRETLQVEAKSLHSLLAEIGTTTIDVLKMDVEGAEVAALQSTPVETLRGIGQITVEFHGHPDFGYDMKDDVEKAIDRVRKCGFVCLDFSHRARFDVLFINRALHDISPLSEAMWRLRANPPSWLLELWRSIPAPAKRFVRTPFNRITGIDRDR